MHFISILLVYTNIQYNHRQDNQQQFILNTYRFFG